MDYKKEYEKWLSYDFLDKDIKKEFEQETDLIVDDGNKINALPSTIVSLLEGRVNVIRQGSVVI